MAKPAYATGAQVEHTKFGPGSVLSCNDQHIVIKFDELGEKKFVCEIALASIRKIDRQPPAEKKARARKPKVAAAAVPVAAE
jgi:hypothetical protein